MYLQYDLHRDYQQSCMCKYSDIYRRLQIDDLASVQFQNNYDHYDLNKFPYNIHSW